MKKLNNKGYMLIEIILASAITFTIAFFLLSLIVKFKDTNEDLYNDTALLNDRIAITKNIINDLENSKIVKVEELEKNDSTGIIARNILVKEPDNNNPITKRIEIKKRDKTTITYGRYENGSFVKKNKSYFYKTIANSVDIGEPNITAEGETITISIPMSSVYSNKKYDIKLLLKSDQIYTISFDDNLFAAPQTEHEYGVEKTYDEETQIITLNGEHTNHNLSFAKLNPITVAENEKYIITLKYIAGSITSNSPSNEFVLDLQKDGANYPTRVKGTHYMTVQLPTEQNKIARAELTYTLTDTNGLNFGFSRTSTKENEEYKYQTTFNNYKMQVSITKERNKQTLSYGQKYGEIVGGLPIPNKGNDYEFDGWYTELNGENRIDNNTTVSKTESHTLYAHWR